MGFKLMVGHDVTLDEALAAAEVLERAVGEIGNGRRKAGDVSLHELCVLVQFARDAAARRAGLTPTARSDLPTYQHYGVMDALKDALRPLVRDGEMLIWRDAFRWKNDAGVLPNHYESMDIARLCDDFGYEVVHDFQHVAVVRAR